MPLRLSTGRRTYRIYNEHALTVGCILFTEMTVALVNSYSIEGIRWNSSLPTTCLICTVATSFEMIYTHVLSCNRFSNAPKGVGFSVSSPIKGSLGLVMIETNISTKYQTMPTRQLKIRRALFDEVDNFLVARDVLLVFHSFSSSAIPSRICSNLDASVLGLYQFEDQPCDQYVYREGDFQYKVCIMR